MATPNECASTFAASTYTGATARVREIVRILNRDGLEPQEMLTLYEEGCRRLQEAEAILRDARLRVQEITAKYGIGPANES